MRNRGATLSRGHRSSVISRRVFHSPIRRRSMTGILGSRIVFAPLPAAAIAVALLLTGCEPPDTPPPPEAPEEEVADRRELRPGAPVNGGLITVQSAHGFGETVDRLEAALEEEGMEIITRIDHAAGAAGAGETLLPTVVILAGDPESGTPLIQARPTAAIDLPQRFLVWQDDDGVVRIAYNDPDHLTARHGFVDDDQRLRAMAGGLTRAVGRAAGEADA